MSRLTPRTSARRGIKRRPIALLLLGAALALGTVFAHGDSDASTPRAETAPAAVAERTSSAERGSSVDQEFTQEALAEGTALEEREGPPIAHVFLVLIAILVAGKLFGEMAERAGQPAVLGELLAGVILGGSVLGIIPPMETELGHIIHIFAEIGVAILLFEIGLETDLKEMFRVGPSASAVALVGVALPFGFAFLYWYFLQPSIGAGAHRSLTLVAIFVGATLTATSVGITARVLSDLRKMHTPEARIVIGAAVIDDVLGIVILAVVAGLAGDMTIGVLAVGKILLFAVGFLVVAIVVGNLAAPTLFDLVDRMRVRGVLLVFAFCFALLLAALADLAGSAMIIGAFAAGIVLSSTNQFDAVVERIEPVADIFTPIFFVAVGAPVNVGLFIPTHPDFDITVLAVGGALTLLAILGKLAAGYVVRRPEVDKLIVGVGMVPRGEVGLIFAALGLTSGILTSAVYSAILIMVIATTFVVPPILKVLFKRQDATRRPGATGSHPGISSSHPAIDVSDSRASGPPG